MGRSTVKGVIEARLEQVDTARVLAVSAALMMRLDNVNELLILERLSMFAGRRVGVIGRDLSASAVRRLLSAEEVGGADVLRQLDPFEDLPVREFNFPPGRYLVSAGLTTGSVEVAARMTRAVFTQPQASFPGGFLSRVGVATSFLAALNDHLCREFGRAPNEPVPPLQHKVTVPAAVTFNADAAKVIFTDEELFGSYPPPAAAWLRQRLVREHVDQPARATETINAPQVRREGETAPNLGSTVFGTPNSLPGARNRVDRTHPDQAAGEWPPSNDAGSETQGPWWESGAPDGDGVLDGSAVLTPIVATEVCLS